MQKGEIKWLVINIVTSVVMVASGITLALFLVYVVLEKLNIK